MLEQGPSKNANLMEWDKLWATNVKIIDPVCPRYSAIGKVNMATVEVANWKGGELDVQSVAQHQKNPELGERPLFRSKRLCLEKEDAASFVVGEKVTFMRWGNVRVQSIAT
jgi:glutamyl-tRNA synthetase